VNIEAIGWVCWDIILAEWMADAPAEPEFAVALLCRQWNV
jgi:hypothetical protein